MLVRFELRRLLQLDYFEPAHILLLLSTFEPLIIHFYTLLPLFTIIIFEVIALLILNTQLNIFIASNRRIVLINCLNLCRSYTHPRTHYLSIILKLIYITHFYYIPIYIKTTIHFNIINYSLFYILFINSLYTIYIIYIINIS